MGYHWGMDDPLDPPDVWTVRLADQSAIAGTLGGILKDLRANGFEVLAVETVPTGVVSVVGVHPFRGRATFAGSTPSGSVAGHVATVTPHRSRTIAQTATQARAWAKSVTTQEVSSQ